MNYKYYKSLQAINLKINLLNKKLKENFKLLIKKNIMKIKLIELCKMQYKYSN